MGSGRLASPRFRRRALRVALLVTVAAAAALALVFLRNTSPLVESPLRGRAQVYVAPTPIEPAPADRRAALATAARFVETAVRREHAELAYDLVGPSLRGGTSRADWRGGDIPVVPYPVDDARWQLDYAYAGEIGLQVAVFPPAGATLRPLVFDLSLRSFGRGEARRWLVESWSPRGAGGSGARRGEGSPLGVDLSPQGSASASLGVVWLLVPLGLVGLVLLVPAAVAIAVRVRVRRAERSYQNSSSSPS
jgi:hypothetical protein